MSQSGISIVRGQGGDLYLQQCRDNEFHRMLSSIDQIEALVEYLIDPDEAGSGNRELPGPQDTSLLIRVYGHGGSFSVAQGQTCIYGGTLTGKRLAESWEQFVSDDEPIDLSIGAERRSAPRNSPGSTNSYATITTESRPRVGVRISGVIPAAVGRLSTVP